MQATEARNRFGEMLREATIGPVLIQRNGRDVAVVMSKSEYDRRFATQDGRALVERYHEESIGRFGELYKELTK